MILHNESFPCSTPGCTGDAHDAGPRGGHSSDCPFALEGEERTFYAEVGGTCAVCEQWIPVGCRVRRIDGLRRHDECPDVVVLAKAPNGVCPRCWLARAVNGSCGCDD